MVVPRREYSTRQLEDTLGKTVQFIWGLNTQREVLQLLEGRGMDRGELEFARNIIGQLLGSLPQLVQDDDPARTAREALARIDAVDEDTYALTLASANRFHPAAASYLFGDGLKASRGLESARGMARYLARMNALATGSDPARKDSRDADRAFVDKLELRGLTRASRAELAGLVELVLSPKQAAAVVSDESVEKTRLELLTQLRTWYDEWATVAKIVVTKRAQLIRLGLAKRRTSKEAEIVDESPQSPTDAPVNDDE